MGGLRVALHRQQHAVDGDMLGQLAYGLVEETRMLLEKYGEAWPFDSLGYKQARGILRGNLREVDAIALAQQGHRNYAKRQLTWFRREPEMFWFHGFGDETRIRTKVVAMVEEQRTAL